MERLSNAQKIKKLYKEVLADGQEHSRTELFEYAQRKSGHQYTDGMLTGALRTLVTDSNEYVCAHRGWYQKSSIEEQEQESNSIIGAYVDIFQETLRKCRNITIDPFYALNLSQQDLVKLEEIKNCIGLISDSVDRIQ